MIIQELTVIVHGATWPIKQFEIEGVDVKEHRKYAAKKTSVTEKDFPLSADRILNVFIEQTAPNQTSYKVEITGKVTIGGEKRKIKYETPSQEAKYGKVRFIIEKDIQTILEPMA